MRDDCDPLYSVVLYQLRTYAEKKVLDDERARTIADVEENRGQSRRTEIIQEPIRPSDIIIRQVAAKTDRY